MSKNKEKCRERCHHKHEIKGNCISLAAYALQTFDNEYMYIYFVVLYVTEIHFVYLSCCWFGSVVF